MNSLSNKYEFVGYSHDFFDDKSCDEITLRHLINAPINYGYILEDLLSSLGVSYNKHFSDNDTDKIMNCIYETTINQCEHFFRLLHTGKVYAKQYPNLAENGYIHAITVFGWLLPYYIEFDETTNKLPVEITELGNIRPISTNNSPHPFALHYAHQQLAIFKSVLDGTLSKDEVPPHILAIQKRQEQQAKKHKRIKTLLLKHQDDFKRDNIKSNSKQAVFLGETYTYAYLGYEQSTLAKNLPDIKKDKSLD